MASQYCAECAQTFEQFARGCPFCREARSREPPPVGEGQEEAGLRIQLASRATYISQLEHQVHQLREQVGSFQRSAADASQSTPLALRQELNKSKARESNLRHELRDVRERLKAQRDSSALLSRDLQRYRDVAYAYHSPEIFLFGSPYIPLSRSSFSSSAASCISSSSFVESPFRLLIHWTAAAEQIRPPSLERLLAPLRTPPPPPVIRTLLQGVLRRLLHSQLLQGPADDGPPSPADRYLAAALVRTCERFRLNSPCTLFWYELLCHCHRPPTALLGHLVGCWPALWAQCPRSATGMALLCALWSSGLAPDALAAVPPLLRRERNCAALGEALLRRLLEAATDPASQRPFLFDLTRAVDLLLRRSADRSWFTPDRLLALLPRCPAAAQLFLVELLCAFASAQALHSLRAGADPLISLCLPPYLRRLLAMLSHSPPLHWASLPPLVAAVHRFTTPGASERASLRNWFALQPLRAQSALFTAITGCNPLSSDTSHLNL